MTGAAVTVEASTLPAADVVTAARTDPSTGLTAEEAARRLAQNGRNELLTAPPEPWWRTLARQFQDPLVYLLGVAIVISAAAWVAEGAHGVPVDALVIGAIVVANALIGYVQQAKVADAVAALATLTAATSVVVRDGELVDLPSAELVLGDLLVLTEGDSVGADARVLSAVGLAVHEASLTGESVPVEKSAERLPSQVPVADRCDMVFKGTAVARGSGRAVVTATGMATEMGAIAELLGRTEAEPSPLQRELGRVSRALGVAVVAIAIVVMAALLAVAGVDDTAGLVAVLLLGVSLAVAAVPEGLPAVLSLVLALGVRSMARRQAIMKALTAVETLGSASVVCSDKTGTLTRNEMTVQCVLTPSGIVDLGGTPTPSADAAAAEAGGVLVGAAVANNAVLGRGGDARGDPTEVALAVAARRTADLGDRVDGFTRLAEVPFSSERKLMSVVARDEQSGRLVLFTKGAPDVLLERCVAARRDGDVAPLDGELRSDLVARIDRLSAEAYRGLGVAAREMSPVENVDVAAERELVFLGVAGLIDPPRDEVPHAVREAQRAGVRVVMITGDHPATALRIASDLGIVGPGARVLTGIALSEMSDEELRTAVQEVSVYARVSPEHKLRIVEALQRHGGVVAMTGDGVNDAPALKRADIGVAMGITGTEVAKEASTMILGDDNFATIIAAVRQGRVIFDNIRKFLRYLLSSNMGEVLTVFFGVLLAAPLGLSDAIGPGAVAVPLLATQILWINLVTDSGPALALGVDPEIDDVMARPPRSPGEPILDRAMWFRVLLVGVTMALVALAAIDLSLPGGLLPGRDSLDVARTTGFTTLVLAQLFNALSSRSQTQSALRDVGSNRWLLGALLVAALLQVAVVEIPVLQQAFGTASLGVIHWLWAVGLAALVLVPVEIEKAVRRWRRRLPQPHPSPR